MKNSGRNGVSGRAGGIAAVLGVVAGTITATKSVLWCESGDNSMENCNGANRELQS